MIKKFLVGVLAFSVAFTLPKPGMVFADDEQDVVYYEQVEAFKDESREDVTYVTSGVCKYYIKEDGSAKLVEYTGSEDNIVIPSVIDGYVVTEIGPDTFLPNYSAETLTISGSVTNINDQALRGMDALECIYVENGNTAYKVVDNVLFDTTGANLIAYPQEDTRSVYCIPEGVIYIGSSAFENADNLLYITMPDSVIGMGDYVFSGADGIRSVVLSSQLKNIGVQGFWSCDSLEDIILPKGLETIGELAFAFCSRLTKIEIPDSVTSLGEKLFDGCSNLVEVELSSSLKTIPKMCFSTCLSLESLVIPEGVETLSSTAFYYANLKKITLPESLKTISYYAFGGCSSLTDVYYGGDSEAWNNISINKTLNECLFNATKHCNVSVKGFVSRLYSIALNREADAAGLNNWVAEIEAGRVNAANAVEVFLNGEEFKLRGLSNADYVDVLYRTFFNREADTEGKNFWVSTLDAGFTREFVLSQFVNLDEFKMLCDTYGVERGIMFENGVAATPGVVQFVNGLYENVLGRKSDTQGLYTWAFNLTVGAESAYSVAYNFFNSQEYLLSNTDSMKYVLTLYKVFMNRGADGAGFINWSAAINAGVDRNDVLAAFAGSAEFAAIAAGYGIR